MSLRHMRAMRGTVALCIAVTTVFCASFTIFGAGHTGSKEAERSNVEPLKTDLGGEQKDRWLRQIFDLAQSPVANDDTINFYGFFPGMSRHDAQVLAEYYNLDGDECRIYTVGEKGVYSITLDIKAVARILKTVSRVLKTDVAVGTYEEIAQTVANAVGDLKSKGTRNVTGERWGDRTYFNEHVSQWYERALVDGTYLKLARNGMAITGNKNLMSRMPVETASAKSQRLETTKTVIQNLLNSMVDIPVETRSTGILPFKMGKCEVTQLQWTHVMGNNPSEHMSSQIGSRNSGDCPVDDVSWDDCQEFLKEFNALPEVKKTGLTFRLPTVEEWEYACRAGASDGVCKLANGREIFKTRIDEVAWIEVTDGIMRPVGLKTPNAFGMFDMIGNASEWTCSWDKEYKDRCIVIGGRCNSRWNDDSSKKLWRDSERSNYKRGKLGFRLCASKFKTEPKREVVTSSRGQSEDQAAAPAPNSRRRTRRDAVRDSGQSHSRGESSSRSERTTDSSVDRMPAANAAPASTKDMKQKEKVLELCQLPPDFSSAGKWFKLVNEIESDELRQLILKTSGAALVYAQKQKVYSSRVRPQIKDPSSLENSFYEKCRKCDGNKTVEQKCRACSGSGVCRYSNCRNGQHRIVDFGGDRYEDCRDCKGSGKCQKCGATGKVASKCASCAGKGIVFSRAAAAKAYRSYVEAISQSFR